MTVLGSVAALRRYPVKSMLGEDVAELVLAMGGVEGDRALALLDAERPDPVDVLEQGVEAEVEFTTLEIAQGSVGTTLVDYAPVHLITTATLERIGAEALRYRPNLVVAKRASGCCRAPASTPR